MEKQMNEKNKANFEKENKAGGLKISGFQSYFKAIITESQWNSESIHTDQGNRTRSPKIDPPKDGQLILNKEQRQFNEEKGQSFQQMVLEQLDTDKNIYMYTKIKKHLHIHKNEL